jgi:hypothetical protein
MKKKIMLVLSVIIFTVIAVTNFSLLSNGSNTNISLSDLAVMAKAEEEGGGNQATCYSTYKEPGFLQTGTWIWVCGSCVQVKAKEYSDSGICYF